jgi:hypothetical protein
MPPKKKPKKKPKKDPKTISQNVKQSVVIKIGDTSNKKKRTYTKRAHITPKKDALIGPVNNPQPQLMLQPQRVEPVSRLDPSIEKLKMSANQFDDLSKQTNDLLQRISRTNLMQAQEQLKPPPVVESLIEQPFQTPAATPTEPKTKSKQRKITEFMTPFSSPLELSTTPQSLNDFFESPVESPNTGSQVGLTIPQTTDRELILEEPDDDEQVVVQELSSGAGEEVITELGPTIIGTMPAEEASLLKQGSTPSQGSFVSDKLSQSEPIPYLTEQLVKSDAAGPAEEPTKTKSEAQIKEEIKEIKARERAAEQKAADDKRAEKALKREEKETAKATKFNSDVEVAYNLILKNRGTIGRKGAPTKAEAVALDRYKDEQKSQAIAAASKIKARVDAQKAKKK